MSSPLTFTPVSTEHIEPLTDLFNYYVLNTTYTLHIEPFTPERMKEKLFFDKPYYKAFVVEAEGEIIGFGSVTMWRKQEAYRHTAEASAFLRQDWTHKGVGQTVIEYLENFALQNDIRNLIGVVCNENKPSLKLLDRMGYTQCGYFQGIGVKFGREVDSVYLLKKLS